MLSRTVAVLICVVCLSGWSLASPKLEERRQAQTAPLKPRTLTAADLQKLHWIEGCWRGTGGGVPTFYERYRFEGTTLLVDTIEDDKVKDTSRFELKNGEFGSGADPTRSVATAFDEKSITFANVGRAGSGWKWERVDANQWRAVIFLPATANRAAGERIYTMDRIGK
ncbi:MAG TPA: hypothetical protein VN700_07975 [Vicinamibacterales bacterium]|nr:hypothetical protein [Vicinamibacterales bacterium]